MSYYMNLSMAAMRRAKQMQNPEAKPEKIFFTDLDGTLLNDQKEITPDNQQAINEALQGGHKIVITTGRPLASAQIQAKRLGLLGKGCYVIAFNGGEIYDCFSREIIYRRTIPLPLVAKLFDAAHRLGIHIQTFSETEVFAQEDRPEIHEYAARTLQSFRIVPSISEALIQEPCKLLAIEKDRREVIEKFRLQILLTYEGVLDCYFSNDAYLEIVPDQVSKGRAIRWLCSYLGIPIENSVAAGDAPNDIDMIEAAHIGVAMRNSYPGVAAHADYITTVDNNHDGAAEIIHRFLLEDQ
ncbi:MAG: Cof-type HAD-IIB family hydrolase [Lachnospiraceae bacterium]|nr:Cof-type HAD-IIB family hydrolase [Lachnospiraceae bacterium]